MANSKNAFLSLVCAGLWEKEIRFLPFGSIDYSVIYSIAEVQGVTGLVAAGLEHVADFKPAKKDVVQFIGRTVHIEQRNREMNDFIATMVNKMRGEGIYAVLVKGQGIAQCYKRPLWRPSGDVDFLLDDSGMLKADSFYTPMSKYRKVGGRYSKEIGFGIDSMFSRMETSEYGKIILQIFIFLLQMMTSFLCSHTLLSISTKEEQFCGRFVTG